MAAAFFILAAVFGSLGVLGAVERLPRNSIAGIRVKSTMSSDEAWREAHRAAAPTLLADAAICLVIGVALLVVDNASETAGYAGVALAIVILLVASWQAVRAANS